jgi:hypothetical protein
MAHTAPYLLDAGFISAGASASVDAQLHEDAELMSQPKRFERLAKEDQPCVWD